MCIEHFHSFYFSLSISSMRILLSLLTLLVITTTSSSSSNNGFQLDHPHQIIHLLRPKSGSFFGNGAKKMHNLACHSWRLGVETNNIIDWETVPESCGKYIGHYMLGHQYRKDSKVVVNEAFLYVQSINLTGDGKEMWVFDIDETTLSNLPYYVEHGFGVEVYNETTWNEWVLKAEAPPLPESLKLYKKLVSLGIKIAFITGRPEAQRNATATNLRKVGYNKWENFILRGSADTDTTAVVYKSSQRKNLEKKGYRIIGNMGDQWSDILGTNTGDRTFKMPDPMYYIS